jgi:dolichyl-diphosphooligosaccharide--protein glycosyltransferase
MDNIGGFKIGEENLIKKRKEKLAKFFRNFFSKGQAWALIFLIILVILGIYVRSLPMTDHNGNPGLWDVTTNTWTLGPDLDPWLFLRNAKTIVNQGTLPQIDEMRNVPLGFDNSRESKVLAYMIAGTYKILKSIGMDVNIEYAGVIFPVIMFAFTIIAFFLFVREIFIRRTKQSINRANAIALIAGLFMAVIPVFLSRTVAGIPEKESAAFFFMFFSFYLFLKSWKTKTIKKSIFLGVLAGIFTGTMGLIWGGVLYVYITIGLAGLIAFILGKVRKKHFLSYVSWVIFSFFIMTFFSGKFDLFSMFTSLSSGIASFTLIAMIMHNIIWNTKISKIKFFRNAKLPKTITTLIFTFILLIILSIIFLGPSFIIGKIKAFHQTVFKPVQGRWNTTVAENRQPNFKEWGGSFGPFVKNIPLMFWLFIIGSIVLFKKMLMGLRKKEAWVITTFYVLFIFGMIFSRYSGDSIFDGNNFISKAFYYLSAIIFIGILFKYYLKDSKNMNNNFRKIRFEYLLLFSLFILTLFSVRGAVRLIMVLGPVSSIFVGFLIVESINKLLKTKDETGKIILGIIVLLILISSIYTFITFYKSVTYQSYNMVPSSYNVQWQKAMDWVRTSTPLDSVFAHWWDYGYWVQSIGNRATIVDGGNAITFWNYYMGRLVLTGDNQNDALNFLYTHNADYLLIDSTDIGKYGAFSVIGSDKDFDRYSWIGTFFLDESQTQETKDSFINVYTGGINLDEDLIINQNGKEIFIASNNAGVAAILTPKDNQGNFLQPSFIVVQQGNQYTIPMRYLYFNDEFIDFDTGVEATAYIFPRLTLNGNSVSQKLDGAVMFISPRLMRGMLAQVYLLDDPLNKFPNFELVHNETPLIIEDLRRSGASLPNIVYLNGLQGPIKIWKIKYNGNEKIKEEYLDIDASKYLDWKL